MRPLLLLVLLPLVGCAGSATQTDSPADTDTDTDTATDTDTDTDTDSDTDTDTDTDSDTDTDTDTVPEPTTTALEFQDHGAINPFTGGVAWETSNASEAMSMEWAFVGLSDVYPTCAGTPDWSEVDRFLQTVAARGHQAILRPVIIGPGYGDESYAPSDLPVSGFTYEGSTFANPIWDDKAAQDCILQFIDAFAARYKADKRIAYVQMGLAGLWGEHHLDQASGNYTASNFPSIEFQRTMFSRYLNGFGSTSSDLLVSVSLDSAQQHGFFGSTDTSLDAERIGFFDDTLLEANHAAANNWRQDPAPVKQLTLHKKHGWGGEAYWNGCNSTGSWAVAPYDCGQGEGLGDQAQRLGLNYMLGSPAFQGGLSTADLVTASQLMGYKFTAKAAIRYGGERLDVTVQNTGTAHSPYTVQVCTPQGCAGDLSTLAPGDSVVVSVPASTADTEVLTLTSPRLDPSSSQKIRWSNAGADDVAATLTIGFE